MSQSSTNASSTNANTTSTPQSQLPLSGFANFANQSNPVLPNQIPQFSQQQQQQIIQNYFQSHQMQQQTGSTFNTDPFSQFLAQQLFQQQFQSQPIQPQQREQEIVEETPEVATDSALPGPSQLKRKKSCKKVQWSEAEEELLAKAWIHISEDPDVANNQPDRQFWFRIMSLYNEQVVSFGFPERNKDQLNSKFTAMSAQVKAFAGHYAEAERLRTSGSDDASVMEAARKLFRSAEVASFKYERAWLVLRDKSRWRTYAKLETPSTAVNLDDVEIPDDIFADDTTPRPRGKSRGSKRKESSSASDNAQSQATSMCSAIVDQFKKLTKTKKTVAKAKTEMIKVQQEAAYAKAREKDMAFLQTPTAGMTETDAQWIEGEKHRIRVKYGMI